MCRGHCTPLRALSLTGQDLQTKRRRLCLTLATFILGIAAASGCGNGNGNGPVVLTAIISVGVTNADVLIATIREVSVGLDGTVVATFTSPGAPTNIAVLVTQTPATITTGNHSLVITMVSQSSSPNSYSLAEATIGVFNTSGNVQTIDFPQHNYTLATGESITLNFNVS